MDKIRAEFEKWAASNGFELHRHGGYERYTSTFTQDVWEAWQAAIPDPCEWLQDEWDNSYDTSCGNKYEIIDGTPEHNGMKFCTYCGGKLEAITSDATRAETRRKHE